jgi:hypothetical protein
MATVTHELPFCMSLLAVERYTTSERTGILALLGRNFPIRIRIDLFIRVKGQLNRRKYFPVGALGYCSGPGDAELLQLATGFRYEG